MSSPAADAAVAHVALWGSDHPDLGNLAVETLDAVTAVAISAGRMPKPYPHLDANEDAILAATGPAGTLLAVADGHSGFDAARGALSAVRDRIDLLESPEATPFALVETLLQAARQGVREALADATDARRQSRTALSLALVTADRVVAGGWGDTQVVRVRGRKGKVLVGDGPFLDGAAQQVAPSAWRLKPHDVVLVCSDGLRDYLGRSWPEGVLAKVRLSTGPAMAVQGLVEAAWTGGAGDHVSVGLTQAR